MHWWGRHRWAVGILPGVGGFPTTVTLTCRKCGDKIAAQVVRHTPPDLPRRTES